jgi:hypothetical protein
MSLLSNPLVHILTREETVVGTSNQASLYTDVWSVDLTTHVSYVYTASTRTTMPDIK